MASSFKLLDFSRQSHIFQPNQSQSPISLIGAGGSGSWSGLTLAKMGVRRIVVFDPDIVAKENLRSTAYARNHVGMKKVSALEMLARTEADGQIIPVPEKYWNQELHPVVISCVDRMEARDLIWSNICMYKGVGLYVDTRMGGNLCQIHCVLAEQEPERERYSGFMHPSSGMTSTRCGETNIVGCTVFIASIVASLVRSWWVDGTVPKLITVDLNTLQYVVIPREHSEDPAERPETFETRLNPADEDLTVDEVLQRAGMSRVIMLTCQCTVDGMPTINPNTLVKRGSRVILSPKFGRSLASPERGR